MRKTIILSVFTILLSGILAAQVKTFEPVDLDCSAEGKSVLVFRTPQNINCKIRIYAVENENLKLTYTKWAKAGSDDQQSRFADLIDVQLKQKKHHDDEIELNILSPTMAPWQGTDYSAGVNIDIAVPPNFSIDSRTSNSTVTIEGPFNVAEVYNEFGNVRLAEITEETTVKGSYSDVNLSNIKGYLSVETSNGSITASEIEIVEGPAFFETSNGAVKLREIMGSVEVHTSYKPIEVEEIDALDGAVVLTTNYNEINVRNASGELVCETTHSPITLSGISLTHGTSKIETKHAPIYLGLLDINDAQLIINNTYSGIKVELEDNISSRLLVAVDDGGKIHTKHLAIKPITINRNRLEGIVGDGLANIELTVDGIGEINIEGID